MGRKAKGPKAGNIRKGSPAAGYFASVILAKRGILNEEAKQFPTAQLGRSSGGRYVPGHGTGGRGGEG